MEDRAKKIIEIQLGVLVVLAIVTLFSFIFTFGAIRDLREEFETNQRCQNIDESYTHIELLCEYSDLLEDEPVEPIIKDDLGKIEYSV